MYVFFTWDDEDSDDMYIIVKNDSSEETAESQIIGDGVGNQEVNSVSQTTEFSGTSGVIEYDAVYEIINDDSLSMEIEYNVHNGNTETENVTLIAVLYEDNRLFDIKTKSLTVNALEDDTDSILLPMPDNINAYKVKLMVWDNFGTIKPIGNVKQIIDLDDYSREKYIYITSSENTEFNIFMNAETVKGTNVNMIHTLQYDPIKLEPVDLCGFTYEKELSPGEIDNTDVIVESADFGIGKIKYRFNLPDGRNTGITNIVKFKTISEVTDEQIIYTIQ